MGVLCGKATYLRPRARDISAANISETVEDIAAGVLARALTTTTCPPSFVDLPRVSAVDTIIHSERKMAANARGKPATARRNRFSQIVTAGKEKPRQAQAITDEVARIADNDGPLALLSGTWRG